jgi:hypothetical protein
MASIPGRATRRTFFLALAVLACGGAPAAACDLCAVYAATESLEGHRGIRAGVATQYTQYATEQRNGHEVDNEFGEHLYSSNTQLFLGYQFNRRFGLQLNLPILVKSWRRVLEDGELQESTKGGIGDMALLASFLAYDAIFESGVLRLTLLGGLELPTGDTDFLAEELDETDEPEQHVEGALHDAQHDETESGIHGHDLTFGSGSVDGIVGGQLYWSYRRFFASTWAQYKITTEGAFEYEFANDLAWLVGPGYYLALEHDYTLGLQAALSGETKSNDSQQGEKLDDSAVTTIYVGPAFRFTSGLNLSAELEAGIPVVRNNTSLQIVPDFRLRGALVWRF